MALGAGLGHSERQVIALCGDGGISMLLGDLMTISQYKVPVKLVIFENKTLGMVKLEMQVAGFPDWQTDLKNPDFKAVAEAMGIKAWDVRDSVNVPEALKEAFLFKGPALVNIHTDPDALAMPPKVKFDQLEGFVRAMGKLMINGRSAEVVGIAKSNLKYLKELL